MFGNHFPLVLKLFEFYTGEITTEMRTLKDVLVVSKNYLHIGLCIAEGDDLNLAN